MYWLLCNYQDKDYVPPANSAKRIMVSAYMPVHYRTIYFIRWVTKTFITTNMLPELSPQHADLLPVDSFTSLYISFFHFSKLLDLLQPITCIIQRYLKATQPITSWSCMQRKNFLCLHWPPLLLPSPFKPSRPINITPGFILTYLNNIWGTLHYFCL